MTQDETGYPDAHGDSPRMGSTNGTEPRCPGWLRCPDCGEDFKILAVLDRDRIVWVCRPCGKKAGLC